VGVNLGAFAGTFASALLGSISDPDNDSDPAPFQRSDLSAESTTDTHAVNRSHSGTFSATIINSLQAAHAIAISGSNGTTDSFSHSCSNPDPRSTAHTSADGGAHTSAK